MQLKIGSLVALALLVGAAAGCAAGPTSVPANGADVPSPAATDSGTQRDEGGAVTVEATWSGPGAGATFDLTLDTHSVDLDPLDLSDATLRNDQGVTLVAQPWTAPKGGHHRRGVLSFEGDEALFLDGARWMELVLVSVGDTPERVLRWELRP